MCRVELRSMSKATAEHGVVQQEQRRHGEEDVRPAPLKAIVRAESMRVVREPEDYTEWQLETQPTLAGMGHEELVQVLYDAKQRLPSVPKPAFMHAWMAAAESVLEEMPLECWFAAEELGARPMPAYLKAIGSRVKGTRDGFKVFNRHAYDFVRLLVHWGANVEALRPFLETWEQQVLPHLRPVLSSMQLHMMGLLRDIVYMPTAGFVDEWMRTATALVQLLAKQGDVKGVWDVVNAALSMPVRNVEAITCVLDKWTEMPFDCRGVTNKRVMTVLQDLGDLGHRPHPQWIGQVAQTLIKLLPTMDDEQKGGCVSSLSRLVNPERDKAVLVEFVRAYAAATIPLMATWQGRQLARTFAALVRMQIRPNEAGRDWYVAWLKEGRARKGGGPPDPAMPEMDLLLACLDVARQMFYPTRWTFGTQGVKAAKAIRQLGDMQTLMFGDSEAVNVWLDNSRDAEPFLPHQVKRGVQYLRILKALPAMNRWERRHDRMKPKD